MLVIPLRSGGGGREDQMRIFMTATYQVRASGVERVTAAIDEFVADVRDAEPGTELYQAWQRQDDPTSFLHLFIFASEDARRIHSESEAVARFEAVYRPELVGGDVVFTDYTLVARNDAAVSR
jgi:quinol monooxygenase YgiN